MKTLPLATFVCVAITAVPRPATAAPGDLDAFNLNLNANGIVNTAMVQPDGKIVMGGEFAFVNNFPRNRIVRFDAGGVWDGSFAPDANSNVYCAAVQADGKILAGGVFVTMNAESRKQMARLHADGTLDATFNPSPDAWVNTMAVQPDGKIVIGGGFHFVGLVPVSRGFVARVNADGTLDTGFDPNAFDEVYNTTVQPDGKIVIGGAFVKMGAAVTRNRIARVNANGTLDTGFDPNADARVYCTAVQTDGKILLGGDFTHVGGVLRNHIARVNANGTLDTGFDPNASDRVYSIVVQADGKILIGGLGGSGTGRFARLNADGTADLTFATLPLNGGVHTAALQANGKVLIGGAFTGVGTMTRNRIARLDNGSATESLTAYTTTRVQWLRGGTAPEVEQVTFELSTNGGTVWTQLGAGTRIAGGWELTGPVLPGGGHLRARARTSGGKYNGSSGMVETVAPFTAIFGGGPRITNLARSGKNLVFTFPIISGYNYTLWHTNSLDATWADTGLPVINSAAAIGSFTIAIPDTGIPKRFYRVQVSQ